MNILNFIKKNQAIITADDFCISQGVDFTIIHLLENNRLTCASAMACSDRFIDSIKVISEKSLNKKIGLHLDFTYGKALSINGKSLITDKNSNFNKSFIGILFLCLFLKKQMSLLIESEIKAQVKLLQKYNGCINHIDGHQHIHMIPLIFKYVKKYKKLYSIPRIRFVNEAIFSKHLINIFNIKNIIKLILLRFLGYFNKYNSDTYFLSIYKTCQITDNFLQKYGNINKKYKYIELMLHPGNSMIDKNIKSKEKSQLTSKYRDIEAKLDY